MLSCRWNIIKLHSSLRQEAEKAIFQPARRGERKIILSTNLAESSITIADVKYIFDFGLTKRNVVDKDCGLSFLKLEWCSKAEVEQRTGRSGRVQRGKVRCLVMLQKTISERNLKNKNIEISLVNLI